MEQNSVRDMEEIKDTENARDANGQFEKEILLNGDTSKKEKDSVLQEQNIIDFKSSHILLEMAKDEYAKERDRANSLDNKAGFFITVIITVTTIFLPIIPLGMIIPLYQNGPCYKKCIISILLTGLVIAFFMLLYAFRKLYDAYKLKDYKRPNLECIGSTEFHTASNQQVNKGLCEHYRIVVDDNIAVNEKKCSSIIVGIRFCGIGIWILISVTIIMLLVIGG